MSEILDAIHAKTNAIDAVNEALKAEWTLLEELDAMVKDDKAGEFLTDIRAKVAELKALNSALPAAVVANVAPATAGPVGKSAAEHLVDQTEAVLADSMVKVKEAAEKAGALAEHLRTITEGFIQSAVAVSNVKARQ